MKELQDLDYRVKIDDSDNSTPGKKYSHWELKGVPLRIEIGKNDVDNKTITLKRRDDLKNKIVLDFNESSTKKIIEILDDIQISLFKIAKEKRDNHRVVCKDWDTFVEKLNQKNVCLVPWCNNSKCEEEIKKKTKEEKEEIEENKDEIDDGEKKEGLSGSAKSLCMPYDKDIQKEIVDEVCFHCGEKAKVWCMFGRSY
jgi:prolyl-tRNA synthetase